MQVVKSASIMGASGAREWLSSALTPQAGAGQAVAFAQATAKLLLAHPAPAARPAGPSDR